MVPKVAFEMDWTQRERERGEGKSLQSIQSPPRNYYSIGIRCQEMWRIHIGQRNKRGGHIQFSVIMTIVMMMTTMLSMMWDHVPRIIPFAPLTPLSCLHVCSKLDLGRTCPRSSLFPSNEQGGPLMIRQMKLPHAPKEPSCSSTPPKKHTLDGRKVHPQRGPYFSLPSMLPNHLQKSSTLTPTSMTVGEPAFSSLSTKN